MDHLFRDLRFGVRTLLKNRWFTLLAIVTLGLGIGANTAIFSVIDGVLLKPLPYANGDRLLLVREAATHIGQPTIGVSIAELYDYRAQTRAFDALVEYHQMNFDLLNRGEPDRVCGAPLARRPSCAVAGVEISQPKRAWLVRLTRANDVGELTFTGCSR